MINKVKDYHGLNYNVFTPTEPLLQSKKYRNDMRNTNEKKHTNKGHSHAAPKYSVLKNGGLEVIHGSPLKEERKTRYAADKDTKHMKHGKHSAYPKGTHAFSLSGHPETSPSKKKKVKKIPPVRGNKMIKRDSNKSPRPLGF